MDDVGFSKADHNLINRPHARATYYDHHHVKISDLPEGEVEVLSSHSSNDTQHRNPRLSHIKDHRPTCNVLRARRRSETRLPVVARGNLIPKLANSPLTHILVLMSSAIIYIYIHIHTHIHVSIHICQPYYS